MHFPSIEELKKTKFTSLEAGLNKPLYDAIKRFLDIVISFMALILFLPFWLLIVVAIRLDSPGKAFFQHTRIGRAHGATPEARQETKKESGFAGSGAYEISGKPFTLYKFRTMYQNSKDQELAPQTPRDERITKVGRFLRRTSFDEIPQLINIFLGDMSLVGPRPEMPFIVEKYSPLERKRLLVKPGLTGLWQIMGRKDLPLHHNLEFDFYYIQHRSLLLDFVIIVKTVGVVISGKGAY